MKIPNRRRQREVRRWIVFIFLSIFLTSCGGYVELRRGSPPVPNETSVRLPPYSEFLKIRSPRSLSVDGFGKKVALSGSVMAVSAPYSVSATDTKGCVYLYDLARMSDGLTTEISASNGTSLDYFGQDIALTTEDLVVGAPMAMTGGLKTGAAYVFHRNLSGWEEAQVLVGNDSFHGQRFGEVIAFSKDLIVVGAPYGTLGGAAYVFERSGGAYVQTAKLVAPTAGSFDYFAASLSVTPSQIAVGATGLQRVYVYQRTATGWSLSQEISGPSTLGNERFGTSIAISDRYAAIGSTYDRASGVRAGAAHIYSIQNGTWIHAQQLLPKDASDGMAFGEALALSENTLAIGAPGWYSNNGEENTRGAGYVFELESGTWTQKAKLKGSSSDPDSFLGESIAIENGLVLLASPYLNDTNPTTGSVFLYR